MQDGDASPDAEADGPREQVKKAMESVMGDSVAASNLVPDAPFTAASTLSYEDGDKGRQRKQNPEGRLEAHR